MCMGIDYAPFFKAAHDEAATLALTSAMKVLEQARHDVDCDNIQQYVLDLEDRSTLVTDYLPAASESCVCFMYPIDPVCLGEGDKYLISAAKMPCHAHYFDRIHNPRKYVEIPYVIQVAIYRSLADGGGGDGEGKLVMPEITLPEGSCVKNSDGSVVFTLKLSKILMTDAEVDAAIASGKYSNRIAYNLAIGKACAKELLRNMAKHEVETKNLFAMSEEDPTQVHPEAMINFLDMLLPNVMEGKDMIVGIPEFDDNGKSKSAAFPVWFRYPEGVECLPLLGLVHNVDTSDPSPTCKVEGNFYIATNTKRDLYALDEHGKGSSILLRENDVFLPDIGGLVYQSGFHKYSYRGPEDDTTRYDYSAWRTACSSLQTKCQSAIWDALEQLIKKEGLPGFDKSVMISTNIKDMEFSKKTMSMSRGKASRKEPPAIDEEENPKRSKASDGSDLMEIEMPDVADMDKVPDVFTDHDKFMISIQHGIAKVHSILARINMSKWESSIVAMIKGMDASYYDDNAIGLSRFALEAMTDPHTKALLSFLEGITGTI